MKQLKQKRNMETKKEIQQEERCRRSLQRLVRPRLTIVRGWPGSGKTTFAKSLGLAHHYEADMWFDANGGFDARKLHIAHSWCQRKAMDALASGNDVVVSNTFTRLWELEPYLTAAIHCNADVVVEVMTGNFKNVHGVPDKKVSEMKARFEWPNSEAERRAQKGDTNE